MYVISHTNCQLNFQMLLFLDPSEIKFDFYAQNFSDLGLSIHLSILIFLTGHPNLAEMLLKHDKPKSVLEIVLCEFDFQ